MLYKDSVLLFKNNKMMRVFFNFFFFLEFKLLIIDLFLIFKYSKYLNNFFVFTLVTKHTSAILNLNVFSTNRFFKNKSTLGYEKIFYFCNLKKKKKLLHLIFKKKAGLFKRRWSLKNSLFYKNYFDIRNFFYKKNNFTINRIDSNNFVEFSNKKTRFKNTNNCVTYEKFKRVSNVSSNNISTFLPTLNFKFIKKKKRRTNVIRVNRKFKKVLFFNRIVFSNFFFYNKVPQHKITKYISKFDNTKKNNINLKMRMMLFVILLSGRFFFFKQDSFYFIKVFGVFVNGNVCKNPLKILNTGDIIQMPVASTYYYFIRSGDAQWNYFYKKYLKLFQKLINDRKKIAPNWVYKLIYFNLRTPYYLEIDYAVLSIIILYRPKLTECIFDIFNINIAANLFRTYNWRTLA